MKNNKFILSIIPVMLAFFIMGFADCVGIATNYVKQDFSLSDTAANTFSVMLYVWFLVFSIPTGMVMNKIGRKKTVILSMVVTVVGLVAPFVMYSKTTMFIAMSFLGIGNTFMQVSLNPLMANLVEPEKQPSFLTLGQFIKAVASFLGPVLASQAALHFGDWRWMFAVFAAVNVIGIFYLNATDIHETGEKKEITPFIDCVKMLGEGTVLILFIGILMHVGIDVGVNITAPKLLQERLGLPLDDAAYATSIYFLFRTAGCLTGSFVMSRIAPKKFFALSTFILLLGIIGMFFFDEKLPLYLSVGLAGFGNSNVFSVIFSSALRFAPDRNNEISGLLIMGISGGALIPIIMGAASDAISSQVGAVFVLLICVLYLLVLNIKIFKLN